MDTRKDRAWQSASLTATYLEGVRGAVPLAQEQLEVMVRVIAGLRKQVRAFLDLGCGSGVLASAILERYSGAEGVLLDFSGPMLDAARKHLGSRANSLRFVRADFADPAWVDALRNRNAFDAVVSGYAIHHQPDARKQELYAEIYGLLGPGGVFVNVEHVAPATPRVEYLFETAFVDNLVEREKSRGGARSRDELAAEYYHREDKNANILTPAETQCDWLRSIGFRDVDIYFKIFELAVFGGRRP